MAQIHTALIGLDPLFLTNVKLLVEDVLELNQIEEAPIELYSFYDNIIKFVEICGLIVAVEKTSLQIIYTIDDSTGTIPCHLWDESLDYKPLEIGTSVRILGKIATYRDERQITIYDIFPTHDPNQELTHFIQTMSLREQYQIEYITPTRIAANEESLIRALEYDSKSVVKQDVSLQEGRITEVVFEEAMLSYLLKDAPVTFTMGLLRNNAELINYAKGALITESLGITPAAAHISDLFARVLGRLRKRGYVTNVADQNNVYKLVDRRELENYIMRIISDLSKETKFQRGGTRLEYITVKVLEDILYTNMTRDEVRKVVYELVDRGLVYPTGEREFKVAFV